jgi:glycosyltransferase involved in cell wall biosynthesis
VRIAVLVPCRNEAAVIGRKLANLARAAWPASTSGEPHAVFVIDDGSEDATAEVARAAAAAHPTHDFTVDVLANTERPGKVGAIRTALARCAAGFDLVVLSDADVVLEPAVFGAFARAFEGDARRGMACAAQRFVADLAADGTCRSRSLGEPVDAGGRYDRWTASVRRFESRRGILYSVHGQCLAWRASLGIAPRDGFAADDLDLMLQVRALGLRVELLPAARFLEQKTPRGARRTGQALRRARAYVQVVRNERGRDATAFAQWQRLAYRHVPLAAPWLAFGLAVAAPLAAWLWIGPAAAALALGLELFAASTTPGWRLCALLVTIARAMLVERRSTLSDRWEMARA